MEPNRQDFFNLFRSYMDLWYEYVNAYNRIYAEYIRNIRKMTEPWLDLFKFWSGQYKDKVKVE